MKYLVLIVIIAALGVGGFFLLPTAPQDAENDDEAVFCTLDAKICPDGSAVGRVPPTCEFAACPAGAPEQVTVVARVGETVDARSERITVLKVKDDSRCPVDVQCIWAGTVHVAVRVESGLGPSEAVLEVGVPYTTEVNSFTLVTVAPAPHSGQAIPENEYVFTFLVSAK